MVGQQFGFLLVTSLAQIGKTAHGAKTGTYYALCRCLNCGKEEHPVLPVSLRRGATTSCGCGKKYATNSGKNHVLFRGYEEIRSHFWKGYERGAKDRNIPFGITMEYAWGLFVKQRRLCALSGVPLVFGSSSSLKLTTASIDRIDCAQGYIVGNIQWVHKKVNVMRHILGVTEFVDWCRKVVCYADNISEG
jgi:hypothetical protein